MVQFITGLSLFAFFTRQVNSFIIFYDPGLGNTQYTEIFHLTHTMLVQFIFVELRSRAGEGQVKVR